MKDLQLLHAPVLTMANQRTMIVAKRVIWEQCRVVETASQLPETRYMVSSLCGEPSEAAISLKYAVIDNIDMLLNRH